MKRGGKSFFSICNNFLPPYTTDQKGMSLQWTNELIEHGAGGPVGRFVPQPKETASQGRPAEVRIHSLLTFFSAASRSSSRFSYFSGDIYGLEAPEVFCFHYNQTVFPILIQVNATAWEQLNSKTKTKRVGIKTGQSL